MVIGNRSPVRRLFKVQQNLQVTLGFNISGVEVGEQC